MVLSEMAKLMPKLMLTEVTYLNDYLGCDVSKTLLCIISLYFVCVDFLITIQFAFQFYVLRNSILTIMTEVILNILSKDNLMDEEREIRNFLLSVLEEHILDTAGHVRSKVFQLWGKLQSNHAIPKNLQPVILEKMLHHLSDKAGLARKNAAGCVTCFLVTNPFSGEVIIIFFTTFFWLFGIKMLDLDVSL